MKTKFGFMLTEASGKLGGTVYTKNRWGSISKTKVTPANPQSSRQSFVRNNQLIVTRAWSALSDSQRSSWIKESANHPQKDRFGQTHYLSGFGLFVKCNMNRLCYSESIINTPAPFFQFPNWEVVSIAAYSLNPSIYLFLNPSIPSGFAVIIYASPQLSPGITYCKGQYRLIGYLAYGQTFPTNLYSLYTAVFPDALYSGKRIFFKLAMLHIASGFISNSSVIPVNVSEGFASTVADTWSSSGNLFSSQGIYSLSILANNYVIAGSGNSGKIFRSTDNGVTFTDQGTPGVNTRVQASVVLPNGSILVGAYNTGSIYVSTDNGLTFTLVYDDSVEDSITCFALLENGTILAGTSLNGKLLISYDNGLSFSLLLSLPSVSYIYTIVNCGNGVLILGSFNNTLIYRSTDFGLTWSSISSPYTVSGFASGCYCGNGIVLLGSRSSLYVIRSADYGLTWSVVLTLPSVRSFYSCIYLGNGVVFFGTDTGGYFCKSMDFGLTFSVYQNSFSQNAIRSFGFISGNSILAGTAAGGLVLRSTI